MNASTTPPTPAQELAALVAKVAALSKLALDMAKITMEINGTPPLPDVSLAHTRPADSVPQVIASQVAEAVDALTPTGPQFMHGTARTPDQMDALFPPGLGDHQHWYVVIVGREPGLYNSSVAADAEVNGVPGQFRQKKASRVEALAFYRNRYNDSAVAKISEVIATPAAVIAAPVLVGAAPAAVTQ
ncbi:hypothetical protein DFH09DRAFT_1098968 [Mycena vulgaris]|nr:hypothetical protein DFH09DRAFT_1098968 [Mycena vulgaris]